MSKDSELSSEEILEISLLVTESALEFALLLTFLEEELFPFVLLDCLDTPGTLVLLLLVPFVFC